MTVSMPRRRVLTRRRPARGDPRRPCPVGVRERGMVTAEIAAALPALALVMVLAVWAVVVATTHLRCADAAREAARALARGESMAVVRQVADEVAPDGAQIGIEPVGGDMVRIEVSSRVGMPGPLGDTVPAPTVRGHAVVLTEQP